MKHLNDIDTPRLVLRKIKISDADDMFEYASRKDVTKYLLWSPHEDLQYTKCFLKFLIKKYKKGEYFDYGIELKDEKKLIGTCGFVNIDTDNRKAEIGYVLNPSYQGNGYAIEAVKAVIDYAYNVLNLNRVEARVMEGNTSSVKLLEKIGMTFEGMGREELFVKGAFVNVLHFALIKGKDKL